jgi:hypothetical protein
MNDESWNLERVQRMIAEGVEESVHLDYKGSGSLAKTPQKRDEIVKDVTAFANSDGGVVLYGVTEYGDAAQKHLPEALDPIDRATISKEWLEHVISNASPKIHGLRIYPIPIPGDETKCLYVVEIPRGETAHQAVDCKYYRRFNFESVPMRDHEVRDVMHRIKVPRLEVEAFLGIRNPWEESNLLFKLTNVSNQIARHYAIAVKMPLKLDGVLSSPKDENMRMDQDEFGHYFGFSLGNGSMSSPLFPRATVHLSKEIRCDVNHFEMSDGQPFITRPCIDVRVYADEMVPLQLQFDPQLIRGSWGPPITITSLDSWL